MPQPDQLQDGGETFYYRDGDWTSKTGLCVSTTRAAALSLRFLQHNGRSPVRPQAPAPARALSKVERERTKAVKAAIAKAVARRARRELP